MRIRRIFIFAAVFVLLSPLYASPDVYDKGVYEKQKKQIDKAKEYVAYCDNGRQSSTAAFLLVQSGFKVEVMRGGLKGLKRAGIL